MRRISLAVIAVLAAASLAAEDLPRVVMTEPLNGQQDVDPAVSAITVTFNKPMTDGSYSWCYEDPATFPMTTGQPYYGEDGTTNILPVKLEPDTEYIIWINTEQFTNFKDISGNPVRPYRLTFKTRK